MRTGKKSFNYWVMLISILSFCFLTGCCTFNGKKDIGKKKEKASWLFTQTAESGTISYSKTDKTYTLTLNNVASAMIAFTDIPVRKAKIVKVEAFIQNWNKMFGKLPPNAIMTTVDKSTNKEEICNGIIFAPKYDKKNNTLIYIAKEVPNLSQSILIDKDGKQLKDVPKEFSSISLFIDSGNWDDDDENVSETPESNSDSINWGPAYNWPSKEHISDLNSFQDRIIAVLEKDDDSLEYAFGSLDREGVAWQFKGVFEHGHNPQLSKIDDYRMFERHGGENGQGSYYCIGTYDGESVKWGQYRQWEGGYPVIINNKITGVCT
jgi:hypothetical protein